MFTMQSGPNWLYRWNSLIDCLSLSLPYYITLRKYEKKQLNNKIDLIFLQYVLLQTVTCFTLCSIKAWCAAAVKSVQSVCTGPIVLTGITCAVIDICLRRLD